MFDFLSSLSVEYSVPSIGRKQSINI